MSGYLLDTDTITLAQFGHAILIARLAKHSDSEIHISVVSIQEQMRGWLGRFKKLNTVARIADWNDRFVCRIFPVWKKYPVLALPEPAILRFENLRSQRLNVGMMDLRLAAVALENGMSMVTRNVSDFRRVPGLGVEDWTI